MTLGLKMFDRLETDLSLLCFAFNYLVVFLFFRLSFFFSFQLKLKNYMKFTSKFHIFVKIGFLLFALALFENHHLPFCAQNAIFETTGVPGTFATKLPVVKGLSRYLWGGMDYMMSPKDERLHFIPAFFFGDGDKLVPQAF